MRTCRNCGRPLFAAKNLYCPHCGKTVTTAAPSAQLAVVAPPPNKPRTQALIVGAVILGVVLVATVIFLVAHGNSQSSATRQPPFDGGANPVGGQTTVESTTPDTPTTAPTSATDDPATVVRNFYAAINQHDYQTAWQLGGANLGKPYATFVNGFASTASDDIAITSTAGNTVDVVVTAQWNDGTTHYFTGAYTVNNGQITSGTLQNATGSG